MVGTGSWVKGSVLLLASLLVLGVVGIAQTYETLDELPEPLIVLEDHKYDLTQADGGSTIESGWQDILEVRVYTTEEALIFVIIGNGPMPQPPTGRGLHPMLFVLLDMDEGGSHLLLRDVLDWSFVAAKGYDFLVGYYGTGVGIRNVHGAKLGSAVPIEHWRSENAIYFEIPWTRIGTPDGVAGFVVYAENQPHNLALEITRDLAPDGYPLQFGGGTTSP
jgi:hypothetical protein